MSNSTHSLEGGNDPLRNIIYLQLPPDMERRIGDFEIDPSVPLPLEKPEGMEETSLEELQWEQIIAAMLRIMAYDPSHEHIDYYREFVLAVKPDIVEELTQTGVFKARSEDFAVAEEIFLALSGLLPENPKPDVNLALLYEQMAEAAEKHGRDQDRQRYTDQAFAVYKKLLASDAVVPDAYFNAGHFFLKQRSFDRAREHFENYRATGDEEDKLNEARDIVRQIDAQNLVDNAFKEAFDFIRMGKEEAGIEKAREFLHTNPDVWNGWFLLGWGLRRLERYDEAREAFRKTLDLASENVDILNELSICEMELGNYEESSAHLERALRLEPENTKVVSNLGVLALRRGNRDEAEAYFRSVLELDPEDPLAAQLLAELSEEE
ncbi:MAG: tetratricopeptide repeat protein [Spirochaetaceae bacterium]